MAFLFGRNRSKGNADLARSTKDLLLRVNSNEKSQLGEELAKNLAQMKQILQGTTEAEASPQQSQQLIECLITEDVLYPLALSIARLPFESRKDAQNVFTNVLRFRVPGSEGSSPSHSRNNSASSVSSGPRSDPLVMRHIVNDRPEIIVALCEGYKERESGMVCGQILREGIKNDSIAALILYDEPQADGRPRSLKDVNPEEPSTGKGVFWKFFGWIDKSVFEISADAFTTFSELLTSKHKKLISHYLHTNLALFIQHYHSLLILSHSYVTKRQSIHLLSSLLLERANYPIMTAYIASAPNLKLTMQLLRDDRRMLNYEAFHIFKIFVANPKKSEEVVRILRLNRERLLRFLPGFLEDKCKQDVQLGDEKAYCIRIVEQLPPAAAAAAPGNGSGGASAASTSDGVGASGGAAHAQRMGSGAGAGAVTA